MLALTKKVKSAGINQEFSSLRMDQNYNKEGTTDPIYTWILVVEGS